MSNRAAWITGSKARPLQVSEAPTPTPGPDEVVIKNAAVAINPVDWKIQDYDFWVSYPNILGTDVAGVISAVGSDVASTLKVGQRVIGHCLGLATGRPENGAFQLEVVVPAVVVAPIPDDLSFESAAVLPLALSTAAAALFQESHLGLPYPSKGAAKSGKTILIWGGSSSVGATAIQLAVGAGLTVASTASAKNHDFVKSLGATYVFDHTADGVVNEIVVALEGSDCAGAFDCIALPATIQACADVVSQLGGGMVATVLPPPEKGLPENVTAKDVMATSVGMQQKEVGEAVWGKYVPEALADGRLKAKPDAIVVGNGLDMVQAGFDKQKAGVSAAKIVVALQ